MNLLMGAIELTLLPLDWESDTPVWTPQWPLTKEKLAALTQLVNEQLQKAHIEPSSSPWNSPIFIIKKKSPVSQPAVLPDYSHAHCGGYGVMAQAPPHQCPTPSTVGHTAARAPPHTSRHIPCVLHF